MGTPGSPSPPSRGAASSTTKEKIQKRCVEKRCWPHLRARYLPRGGPGGHYRYPEDRVPLHTSFKMRQREECASVHCHMHCGSGPCLPTKAGSSATTCPSAPDPASLLGRAPALSRVPQLRTHLPAQEGSGAAMCPLALDPASLLGRAKALPRVLQLQTLPPYQGQLRRCYVSLGSEPYLSQLRAPPPCSGGLRRCYVSLGSRPCLPAREGSGAATCPLAPDPASLLGRALKLPRIPQLQTLPPYLGGLRRCYVYHGTGPCLPTLKGSGAVTCHVALEGRDL
jgi:hypothetical protein